MRGRCEPRRRGVRCRGGARRGRSPAARRDTCRAVGDDEERARAYALIALRGDPARADAAAAMALAIVDGHSRPLWAGFDAVRAWCAIAERDFDRAEELVECVLDPVSRFLTLTRLAVGRRG